MPRPRCQRLNKEGKPCGNRAAVASDFCLSHTFSRTRDLFFYIGLVCSIITVIGLPLALFQVYLAYYPPPPRIPVGAEKRQWERMNRKEVWHNIQEGKSAPARREPLGPNVSGGAICQAWFTPVFNPYPVNYSDLSSVYCHDFAIIDVALYRDGSPLAFAQSQDEYESIREFSVGDELVVGIYIDNGGIDTEAYTAKNVRIETVVKSANGLHLISTTFTADNAVPRTGSVYVDAGSGSRLEPVRNSGFMFDYEGRLVLDQQNLELLEKTYELGDLDAGFAYSLFFTYRLKVVGA